MAVPVGASFGAHDHAVAPHAPPEPAELMLDRRAVGDDEGPITAGARLRPERYAPSTWPEMDAAGGQYRHELGVRGKATAGDGGEERIGGRAVDGGESLPNDTLELV